MASVEAKLNIQHCGQKSIYAGESSSSVETFIYGLVGSLKEYKKRRESICMSDLDFEPFPDGGLSDLNIKSVDYGSKGYPDKEGRYWCKIISEEGIIIESFYWMKDNIRGFPDINGNFWYVVYGQNVKLEQFSLTKDYEAGYPDPEGRYWHYFQYLENGVIKEWVDKKEQNLRVKTGDFTFSVPFKLHISNKPTFPHELIINSFLCPITQEVMFDPVLATDGYTYEKEAILQVLERGMISPITGEKMTSKSVFPNYTIKSMIREFLTQHPECWQEVYISNTIVNNILSLLSGVEPLDLEKLKTILRLDPRLLTFPLKGLTLLEHLCQKPAKHIKIYLPVLLNLFTAKDWRDLIQIHSLQDWLKLVVQTCARCSASDLSLEFLNKLQSSLAIKINPIEMALYALEYKDIYLFKLALGQLENINAPIDKEENTLLHLVARQGQTEMARHLVDCGADLKKRNSLGLKAESLARQAGFEEMADQLVILKVTPVLQRAGIFAKLQRLEILEKEHQQLKPLAHHPRNLKK